MSRSCGGASGWCRTWSSWCARREPGPACCWPGTPHSARWPACAARNDDTRSPARTAGDRLPSSGRPAGGALRRGVVPEVTGAQVLVRTRALWSLLWVSATAGGVLLAVSYSMAATRGADQGHYAVFWAGMLVFTVPTVAVAGSRRVSDRLRLGWLATYALFTYLPKLLRNPGGPLYHDEIAHWRQTVGIATTGHLFEPNATIGIISRFPGLH